MSDVFAALPPITGKLELEYEGELRGDDAVAREIVRSAVANVFDGRYHDADVRPVVDWFDLGGTLQIDDAAQAAEFVERANEVQGLRELAQTADLGPTPPPPLLAAAIDFVLEGLCAMKKISRSEERTYQAAEPSRPKPRNLSAESLPDEQETGRKKKYYN